MTDLDASRNGWMSNTGASNVSVPPVRLYPLARPPCWAALPAFGALDAIVIIALGIRAPNFPTGSDTAQASWSMLAVGALRALVMMLVGWSRAVRSLGWCIAAVGCLSLLTFFASVNALVLSAAKIAPATMALVVTAAVFPLLHWLVFVVVIGVRRRRNPFAGPRLGLSFPGRWAEQDVDVDRVEEIGESGFSAVLPPSGGEPWPETSSDDDDPYAIQDVPRRSGSRSLSEAGDGQRKWSVHSRDSAADRLLGLPTPSSSSERGNA